jgi:hypothetical protein
VPEPQLSGHAPGAVDLAVVGVDLADALDQLRIARSDGARVAQA